jgi:CheY-like chemotaxis protein/glycine cleavage system H lipoate-binding protein
MTALLVILLCVLFIAIDLVVRRVSARMRAARERRERALVLERPVRLDLAEARSLTRAEVETPRARILAVDDEPVILDSLRKILVLAGYSVDTVERGAEALTLVRSRDYDLVLTDLKMPEMDGVELVKAVKHLRPDLDVAVVTGYGTIETAVETMQHGAVDYVQKPFTEDELLQFTNRLVVRREARLEAQRRPVVRVVAPAVAETVASRDYCVPGGAFVSPGHVWARIDPDGQVVLGIDDFARKALGKIQRIELPPLGAKIARGETLLRLRRDGAIVRVVAPVGGEVTEVNAALLRDPALVTASPYERGWSCLVRPTDLASDLSKMRIGHPVAGWYQEEIARLRALGAGGATVGWAELEAKFFAGGEAKMEPVTEMVGAA